MQIEHSEGNRVRESETGKLETIYKDWSYYKNSKT